MFEVLRYPTFLGCQIRVGNSYVGFFALGGTLLRCWLWYVVGVLLMVKRCDGGLAF